MSSKRQIQISSKPKPQMSRNDQTNNNNKPCNPNQRTQHPPISSFPPKQNRIEIPIEKAMPLWPDFGIEKTNNDIGAITGIRPETVLVSKAEKLRRPSGVKLASAVLEHGED